MSAVPGSTPNLLQSASNLFAKATLRQPIVPGAPSGPLLTTLAQGAIGAGLGYGAGSLLGGWDRKRTSRSAAIAGGLVGMGLGIPEMITQGQMARMGHVPGTTSPWASQLFPAYPSAPAGTPPVDVGIPKAAYLSSYGDYAPLQPGDLGNNMAPDSFGGVSPWLSNDPVSVSAATSAILTDTRMGPVAQVEALQAVSSAARSSAKPWLSTGDLARGAVEAGLGMGAGLAFGKVLGAVAGLPSDSQRSLGRIGALAGLLRAFGVWG